MPLRGAGWPPTAHGGPGDAAGGFDALWVRRGRSCSAVQQVLLGQRGATGAWLLVPLVVLVVDPRLRSSLRLGGGAGGAFRASRIGSRVGSTYD